MKNWQRIYPTSYLTPDISRRFLTGIRTAADLTEPLRLIWFGRTYDIELYSIKNNNTIKFDNTWSSTNDYDHLTANIIGYHGTTIKSYSPGNIVYVSNIWNHMMDTSDTNPSLSKFTAP